MTEFSGRLMGGLVTTGTFHLSIKLLFIVLNPQRIEVVHSVDEVAENVHVVGERIEGRDVDAAVKSGVRRFGGHVSEIVGSL